MSGIFERKLGDVNEKKTLLEIKVRELDEKILERDARIRHLEATPDPETVARTADSAATIDNENLRAQVAHLKEKINGLEDQLEELRVEKEELHETSAAALNKSKESEKRLKDDVAKGRAEIDLLKSAVSKSKAQVAELEFAVKESKTTLAHTQGEVELLRAEISVRTPTVAKDNLRWLMSALFFHRISKTCELHRQR